MSILAKNMRRPGFEPGAGARQAPVLDQATPSALKSFKVCSLIRLSLEDQNSKNILPELLGYKVLCINTASFSKFVYSNVAS